MACVASTNIIIIIIIIIILSKVTYSSHGIADKRAHFEFSNKESLTSDGHQFHQYQQNEQLPHIFSELTENKKMKTCDVGNPGPGLGQKCGG
jgi:hypothetical protein